jgi:hypothetical protein
MEPTMTRNYIQHRWIGDGFLEDIETSGMEVEARRLAIEAIAKLVYMKRTCASELLAKSGVPDDARRNGWFENVPPAA